MARPITLSTSLDTVASTRATDAEKRVQEAVQNAHTEVAVVFADLKNAMFDPDGDGNVQPSSVNIVRVRECIRILRKLASDYESGVDLSTADTTPSTPPPATMDSPDPDEPPPPYVPLPAETVNPPVDDTTTQPAPAAPRGKIAQKVAKAKATARRVVND